RLEVVQELGVLRRRFEVSTVEDEPGGAGLAEEGDVDIGQLRAGEAEHELLADEGLELFSHKTIIGWRPLASPDLRCTITVRQLTPNVPRRHPSCSRKYDKFRGFRRRPTWHGCCT